MLACDIEDTIHQAETAHVFEEHLYQWQKVNYVSTAKDLSAGVTILLGNNYWHDNTQVRGSRKPTNSKEVPPLSSSPDGRSLIHFLLTSIPGLFLPNNENDPVDKVTWITYHRKPVFLISLFNVQ